MYDIDDITASEIAASWHSVMTWSDPGVEMYSVTSTGKIHSEEHRTNLIGYIEKQLPFAAQLDERGEECTFPDEFFSNVEELEALKEWAMKFEIEA